MDIIDLDADVEIEFFTQQMDHATSILGFLYVVQAAEAMIFLAQSDLFGYAWVSQYWITGSQWMNSQFHLKSRQP